MAIKRVSFKKLLAEVVKKRERITEILAGIPSSRHGVMIPVGRIDAESVIAYTDVFQRAEGLKVNSGDFMKITIAYNTECMGEKECSFEFSVFDKNGNFRWHDATGLFDEHLYDMSKSSIYLDRIIECLEKGMYAVMPSGTDDRMYKSYCMSPDFPESLLETLKPQILQDVTVGGRKQEQKNVTEKKSRGVSM